MLVLTNRVSSFHLYKPPQCHPSVTTIMGQCCSAPQDDGIRNARVAMWAREDPMQFITALSAVRGIQSALGTHVVQMTLPKVVVAASTSSACTSRSTSYAYVSAYVLASYDLQYF